MCPLTDKTLSHSLSPLYKGGDSGNSASLIRCPSNWEQCGNSEEQRKISLLCDFFSHGTVKRKKGRFLGDENLCTKKALFPSLGNSGFKPREIRFLGPHFVTNICAITPRRLCRFTTIMSTKKCCKLLIFNDLQKWDFFISVISIICMISGFLSHFRPKKGGYFPFCHKKWPFLDCRFEEGYFQHD